MSKQLITVVTVIIAALFAGFAQAEQMKVDDTTAATVAKTDFAPVFTSIDVKRDTKLTSLSTTVTDQMTASPSLISIDTFRVNDGNRYVGLLSQTTTQSSLTSFVAADFSRIHR